ncbi:MAG: alanine acetyltransferase [Hyphomicrobiales bacterium]|nr:alanine acetyltransferase [Hyphomicrobiales bacterium]
MRWPTFWRRSGRTMRRLDPAWASACAAIHKTAFARPWGVNEVEQLISQRECISDAALTGSGKALLGFVISRLAAPEAEILTIAVDPAHRGKGVGHDLLNHHMSRIAAAGIKEMFLEVDEGNGPALKLYRAYGFQEVGRRPGYYSKADGTRATALILRADVS